MWRFWDDYLFLRIHYNRVLLCCSCNIKVFTLNKTMSISLPPWASGICCSSFLLEWSQSLPDENLSSLWCWYNFNYITFSDFFMYFTVYTTQKTSTVVTSKSSTINQDSVIVDTSKKSTVKTVDSTTVETELGRTEISIVDTIYVSGNHANPLNTVSCNIFLFIFVLLLKCVCV